jgi:hypothetical protein
MHMDGRHRRLDRWSLTLALGANLLASCADDASQATDTESSGSSSSTTDPTTTSTDPTTTTVDPDTTVSPDSSGSSESSGTGESTAASSESTTDGTSSSSAGGMDSSSSGGVVPGACPAGEIGPAVPDTVLDNTFGDSDDFAGSCGGDGSPDVEYTFTAPADGVYTFDTMGSQLDSVLYVLDGTCGGPELGCNDNGDGLQSAVAVPLLADQTVTVVVDGNAVGGLPFTLHANAGSLVCPVEDLGSTVPNTVSGDTASLFSGTAGTCGGAAGNEAGYLFTAPSDGTYSFDTFGSAFTSIIYVRDGACDGPELACGNEGLLADLAAGQQVAVYVDSAFASGAFDLHIAALGGSCPDSDLGNTVPQAVVGNTNVGDNTVAGSCGGDFSPDDVYLFTAPQDALYQFDTFGSALDSVLYLRDGDCGGPELDCNDDVPGAGTDSRVVEGLAAGQVVAIGVDGNGQGAYNLNIDIVPCPDEVAPGVSPQNLPGTTVLGVNKISGSCANSGPADESADHVYSFTAPATGTYTFDTVNVGFDTVLYVLDGPACNAPETACNDDYLGGPGSALSVPLIADETILVVVDGNFLQEGPYTLHVNQLSGACPDSDLGNAVPAVVADSTATADNAVSGSCGGLTGNDVSYTWTAPADGFYTFDTAGSSYQALVYVRDGDCGGPELDCTYSQFGGASLAFAALAQDQMVVVTVDGEGASGDFVLTIDAGAAGGDCCTPHDEPGCIVPDIEDCVCAVDSFCCDNSWDGICAGEAVDICGAIC